MKFAVTFRFTRQRRRRLSILRSCDGGPRARQDAPPHAEPRKLPSCALTGSFVQPYLKKKRGGEEKKEKKEKAQSAQPRDAAEKRHGAAEDETSPVPEWGTGSASGNRGDAGCLPRFTGGGSLLSGHFTRMSRIVPGGNQTAPPPPFRVPAGAFKFGIRAGR